MYFISEALKTLWINKGNSILTILTIMIAMVLMELFFLINFNLQKIAEEQSRNIEIELFLKDDIKPFEEESLLYLLQNSPVVNKYQYFSKDEASKFFMENNRNLGDILQSFEENPLPNSYEIEVKRGLPHGDVEVFIQEIRNNQGIDTITYTGEWVKKFNAVLTVVKMIFTIFNGCLIIGSLFIISNTIKLSLVSREKEVEIMLMVGASHSFIRTPYVLEGCFQGLIGSLLSIMGLFVLFKSVVYQVSSSVVQFTGGYELTFFSLQEILMLILGGGFLGLVGAGFAVKKVIN